MNYKLRPSDLTFSYEGCKRCFYLKMVHNIAQPSIPLPSIFSKIARLLKDYYDGKSISELHVDLPPGIVSHGEKWVRSQPIELPSHASTYALEHPASGRLALSPVTKLGLLYFYPDNINQQSIDRLNYGAEIVWFEVKKDEGGFLSFIDEVLDVLELPETPEHSPNCQWCGYINKLNHTI